MDVFKLFSKLPVKQFAKFLSRHQDKISDNATHPVQAVRHLLSSPSLNDHYSFLTCLCCLHPILWAGASLDTEDELDKTIGREYNDAMPLAPVLDQWEVERIMTFIDSSDSLIRTLVGCHIVEDSDIYPISFSLRPYECYCWLIIKLFRQCSRKESNLHG